MLEKTLESPLDSKEIKPVDLKGDQPWILFGRTDSETPVSCSFDVNSRPIGKVPNAGKDRGQKEKRVWGDEKAGRHQQCNRRELGQTSGDGRDSEAWHAAVFGGGKESGMDGRPNHHHHHILVYLIDKESL